MTQTMWVRMNELYEIANSMVFFYRSAFAIQKAVSPYEANRSKPLVHHTV